MAKNIKNRENNSHNPFRQQRKSSLLRRDSMDFRDLIYQPSLERLPAESFPNWKWINILDQGKQGACTGFGLAAVINYQLNERAAEETKNISSSVSPHMLFEMARHYDQWPGENYDYSSSRGAMKGCYNHGVCEDKLWKNQLTEKAKIDALKRPLGSYYRIMPKVVDVQNALQTAGVVYASAGVHTGWDTPQNGSIIMPSATSSDEGHAFAIVGYNTDGFLVQNSWGPGWGGYNCQNKPREGIALWSYVDFEINVWDLWVSRLARSETWRTTPRRYAASNTGVRMASAAPCAHDIDHHYIHIDDGGYNTTGKYPSNSAQVTRIMDALKASKAKHVLLYAHGGLNNVDDSAIRVDKWRACFNRNGIFEIHFIWETGFFAELKDILFGREKVIDGRAGASGSWWDNHVEKLTQSVGYALWKEMQDDAALAFKANNAGTQFLQALKDTITERDIKVHLVGHSAGSIWHAHLLDAWQKIGLPQVQSVNLLAPACTHEVFKQFYQPQLGNLIPAMNMFILNDKAESADTVAGVYRKSLLYLVSRAYQNKKALVPILGMEIYLKAIAPHPALKTIITGPGTLATQSSSHGGFDNDSATMNSLLEIILNQAKTSPFKPDELKGY